MGATPSIIDGTPYNDADDYALGREALMYFHNAMVDNWEDKYNLDFPTLLRGLNNRGNKFFVEGLGLGIMNADASNKTVQEAMEQLAKLGGGKIPASNGAFTQAIADQIDSDIKFTDISSFVIIESAKDLAGGLQVVGDKVIKTGGTLLDTADSLAFSSKYWLPLLIVGGAFIYIWLMPKRG